jgi:hypothetical protein
MVRTELALEFARWIVRTNCAFDTEEPEGIQNELDNFGDDVTLSIMVLRETLSAGRARILHGLKSKMRG